MEEKLTVIGHMGGSEHEQNMVQSYYK